MAYKKVLQILGISATTVILAGLGVYKLHPHAYKVTDSNEPTCILGGHISYECWCGANYTENIEPLGHSYAETDTLPTCMDDGSKTFTCKICGTSYEEKVDKLGHDYVNGVCTRCKERVITQQTDKDIAENTPTDDVNGNSDNGDNGNNDGGSGDSGKHTVQPQPTEQPSVQPTHAPEPAPQPSTSYVDDDGLPRGSASDMATEWGAETCDTMEVGNCTFDDLGIIWE